jgi:hypothetical protein
MAVVAHLRHRRDLPPVHTSAGQVDCLLALDRPGRGRMRGVLRAEGRRSSLYGDIRSVTVPGASTAGSRYEASRR